jgi:uncharacterized protein YbjT (DUF2867 family)
MTKSTFAIMGATGQIGHILTEELLKKGHHVRAIGRDGHKLQMLKSKGAEIFSGDFTSKNFLTQAFKGCRAVFSLIPPAMHAADLEVFRDKTSEAIAQAIIKAKVTHVLNLSSLGADQSLGTGLIKELHLHEERLNTLPNLNVLHFRAGYFMENFLMLLPSIKESGMITMAIKSDLPVPFVATRDIGMKIAELLDTLRFSGSSVFEFIGPKELTMTEAAKIIGKSIGKSDLKYRHVSYEQEEKNLIASGMTHQIAKLMIDMHRAFNEGKIKTHHLMADHRGKTPFEEFCKLLSSAYRSTKRAA